MSSNRKEEIILATLELASESGLGNVSMNQIAEKIGIKKPSIYNHFASREDLLEAMYQYLREKAKEKSSIGMVDYNILFQGKNALQVLQMIVETYQRINQDEQMSMLYKVIYSERYIEPMAAKIMIEETERMILASKQLFYAMQIHGLLSFQNPDLSAVSFAMTIHGLLEYELDKEQQKKIEGETVVLQTSIQEYLVWFCKENEKKER